MIIKFEEIKKPGVVHRIRRKPEGKYCEHTQMTLHEQTGQVQCELCQEFLDPFVALLVIARGTWWEDWKKESAIEYEAKKVAKVQSAAVEHLYRAGMTPEKYRIRWEKEDVKAKTLAVKEVSVTASPVEAAPDKTAS